MKTLRRRVLALLGAIPILLGLLAPAAAMPCNGVGGPMSCDACLVGILPGAVACASLSHAVTAPDPVGGRSVLAEAPAWFADLLIRPFGVHPAPDAPPPR